MTQMKKKEGEKGTAVLRGKLWSLAFLSVGLSLDGNVLLHCFLYWPFVHLLSVIESLLLNNRPSWVVCILCDFIYLAGLRE